MDKKDVTQLAIEEVRKDKEKCDHVGFYVPIGMEMVQAADGAVLCITGVLCMMCGKIFLPKTEILPGASKEAPEPNKIFTPKN